VGPWWGPFLWYHFIILINIKYMPRRKQEQNSDYEKIAILTKSHNAEIETANNGELYIEPMRRTQPTPQMVSDEAEFDIESMKTTQPPSRRGSDDEYSGVEPMRRVSPPPSRTTTTKPKHAKKQKILRKKHRTLNDRLTELTDYSAKLRDIDDASLLPQQMAALVQRMMLVINNHNTPTNDDDDEDNEY
jgi:hypothetical protein